jgi:TRAP-type C4-dicarboxylate transport system permease small subunit
MEERSAPWTGAFGRVISWLSEKMVWFSYLGLVTLMTITCVEVVTRYVFNVPIMGVYDVTGLIGCVIVSFGLAKTQMMRGHTSVEIITSQLGKRSKAIVQSIAWLISFLMVTLITYHSLLFAISMRHAGEYTATIKIPLAPFTFVMAVAFALFTLVLLVDFLNSLPELRRK